MYLGAIYKEELSTIVEVTTCINTYSDRNWHPKLQNEIIYTIIWPVITYATDVWTP